MTRFTLVRHGQTDWNLNRRIQGSTDIPLNDTGRAQAHEAAAALRGVLDPGEEVVFASSTLSRAAETARIMSAQLGAEDPTAFAALCERNYGEAEGIGIDELAERWGSHPGSEIDGAETRAELRSRVLVGIREAIAELNPTPTKRLVIVAHGGVIGEVIRTATNGELPRQGERLANGSLTTFDLDLEDGSLTLLDYAPSLISAG